MWPSICRFSSSRAVLRAVQHSKVGVSRGKQVSEIQRRLAEFERSQAAGGGVGGAEGGGSEYAVQSIAAERIIQNDCGYSGVLARRAREEEESGRSREQQTDKRDKHNRQRLEFPLKGISVPVSASDDVSVEKKREKSAEAADGCDRGFYVQGDEFVDEYVAGTTADLPDDEMTAPTHLVFGSSDAVEHISFQLPGQSLREGKETIGVFDQNDEYTCLDGSSSLEGEGEGEMVGTVVPERAASDESCGGCGAALHCKDPSLPGFLPLEKLERVEKRARRKEGGEGNVLCRRCHLVKQHNFLLNVNVCPVDYAVMMKRLRMKEEALVILVVDVTDLPGSIHRQLPNYIGRNKPVIVVGNKVDLLPPDARCGYLRRFKTAVEDAVREAGFADQFHLLHTALVSAKTGYGIEDLITEMHLKWTNLKSGLRSDMYLVGCTNAGKSTLFNALLQSDLCKVRAVDLIERATTSVWPGTTISLLKFPVMKPTPYHLELRRRRLLTHKAWEQKEMYARKRLLQETGDESHAVLTGTIQNTYKDDEEDRQPVALSSIAEGAEPAGKWRPDDAVFAKGTWCFDTPGTVNPGTDHFSVHPG